MVEKHIENFGRIERIYQRYYSPAHVNQILCVGRNYAAHISEMNSAKPEKGEVLWFDKPMSSLLLPGEPFRINSNDEYHYEVELGVVIGMRGRYIRQEDALKHVGGWFLGIDFTNRTL